MSAEFTERERDAVYRAIYQRRDVRNYRPEPVPAPVLQRILEAAHQAPSVGFMQPWNFLLLRERAQRERIYEHFAAVNARAAEVWQDDRRRAYQALKLQGILDAPLNVLVTCDPQRGGEHVLGRFTIRETDVYSTCLAVQNLWLAARAEGVGVGWMSIMENAVVAELLGLPSHVIPVAYLTMGYPIEFAQKPMLSQVGWAERLPLAELLFEERWGRRPALPPSVAACPPVVEVPERVLEPLLEAPPEAQQRNAELTKPYGSLGQIELLALRLCALQRTAQPTADAVHLALFAGDHGVTAEGVSAFKADTTLKLVYGYLAGAGVVNAFARQNGVQVHVVDVGVDHDFADARGLCAHKIRRGTRNFALGPAMTPDERVRAEEVGREVVRSLPDLRVLVLGEVGIGNSTSAAALAAALLSLSADEATGRGTGVDDAGLARKRTVVARALALHATTSDPSELLQRLGGYEIAALVGAIEAAAERRALILLDGAITAVAALIAVRRKPVLASYLVAAHRGAEPVHGAVLDALALRPLLELDMRLGEGSGATLAVGLVRASCALMSEVRTYQEANIDRPER